MAKRAQRAQIVRYSTPTPTIRIAAPRSAPMVRVKRRGGRRHGTSSKSGLMHAIAGAAILGYVDKNNVSFPTVPILGRAGTIGVVAYLWGRHSGSALVKDLAVGMLSVATYELVKEGSISGDDL